MMAMHWYIHRVYPPLSSVLCDQEHDELKKKKKKELLELQVQLVTPRQGKANPCPWPGLYVTNKLSLANKPEYKNSSQKNKRWASVLPRQCPKIGSRLSTLGSLNSDSPSDGQCLPIVQKVFFSEMKRTKTSLICVPNCVPGRSTRNLQLRSWCNL